MIDERFSSDAFTSRGLDTEAARELAESLADEVRVEMHQALEMHLRKIVERLNAMGHNLKAEASSPGDNSYPGDVAYLDDWEDETGYHCKLRLGIYTVITTGYAHFISDEEALSSESLYARRERADSNEILPTLKQ